MKVKCVQSIRWAKRRNIITVTIAIESIQRTIITRRRQRRRLQSNLQDYSRRFCIAGALRQQIGERLGAFAFYEQTIRESIGKSLFVVRGAFNQSNRIRKPHKPFQDLYERTNKHKHTCVSCLRLFAHCGWALRRRALSYSQTEGFSLELGIVCI